MNLSIGQRLALGFGAVFALMLLMIGLAVSRLEYIGDGVQTILGRSMRKERILEEWYRITNVGSRRTMAIAKSSDPRLESMFAGETKAAMARTEQLQREMETLLETPEEKAMVAAVWKVRNEYLKSRDDVWKAKHEQKLEEADRLFETVFRPALASYLAAEEQLLDYERNAMSAQAEGIQSARQSARLSLVLGGLAALALGAVIAFYLGRSVVRPLRRAIDYARAIEARDLTRDIAGSGRDEVEQLIGAMGAMQSALRDVVTHVRGATLHVEAASSEVAQGNADLSSRTEQQAASLEETSSAMKALASTVHENTESAKQADRIVSEAAEIANRGGEAVGRVVSTMNEIAGFSKRIQDIILVIDGIAFQTNILALNAAVEAARAGEQGRGFGVVAAEVRTLAQRSAAAAREIKQLITESVAKVDTGVELVNGAGAEMGHIVSSVTRVRQIVSQISAASDEQSTGMGQVDQAVSHMDEMTQQNAALVEEAAAAAATLQEQARELAQAVGQFRLPDTAAETTAAGWDGSERRGPQRAKNVVRIGRRDGGVDRGAEVAGGSIPAPMQRGRFG